MPNAINPNDYNIDNLNTGFLGPILTTDFRAYVLGHNLQDENPEILSNTQFGGAYLSLGEQVSVPLTNEHVQDSLNVLDAASTPQSALVGLGIAIPRDLNLSKNLQEINTKIVENNPLISTSEPSDYGQGDDAAILNDGLPNNGQGEQITPLPTVLDSAIDPRTLNLSQNLDDINPELGPAITGLDLPSTTIVDSAVFNEVLPNPDGTDKIIDIPNVMDTASSPQGTLSGLDITKPRELNLSRNLDEINPQVKLHTDIGHTNPYHVGLGSDAAIFHLDSEHVQDLPDILSASLSPDYDSPYISNQIMNFYGVTDPYHYMEGDNQKLPLGVSKGKKTYAGDVILYKQLSDVGDTTEWVTEGGAKKTSDSALIGQIGFSTYGPSDIHYGSSLCPVINESTIKTTGFVEYSTNVGGDFRSSILGRQLGFSTSSGVDFQPQEDGVKSELDTIGSDQRKFNVRERIKLNFISDTIGKINADPFGLMAGQDLITRDYTITQPPGFIGKALDFAANLAGFQIPTSILPRWKSQPGNDGTDVSSDLLRFTANGTKSLLYNAIELNKWGPSFEDGEKSTKEKTKLGKIVEKVKDGVNGTPPTTVKYTDPILTDDNPRKDGGDSLAEGLNKGVKNLVNGLIAGQEEPTLPTTENVDTVDPIEQNKNLGYDTLDGDYFHENYGKDDLSLQISKIGISVDNGVTPLSHSETRDRGKLYWETRTDNPFKRGLLKYTQQLINKETGKPGSGFRYVGAANSTKFIDDKTGKHKVEEGFSMGNRISSGEGKKFDELGNQTSPDKRVYCRSWTMKNPYSRFEDTIRHQSLIREPIFQNLSVLEDNGMPKIVPYQEEYMNWKESLHTNESPSKYMLSIENLAWQNTREFNVLPNIEKGPHGGRLMWFPPYDINFTDNSSVNWESTSFIGRAEPIYTYNNTERTGTLSFTILTDHPSSLNTIRNDVQGSLEKYFAGCADLKTTAFGDVTSDEEIPSDELVPDPIPVDPPSPSQLKVEFYFQNAADTSSTGRDVTNDIDVCYEAKPFDICGPVAGSGLNANFQTQVDAMVEFLLSDDGKRFKISSKGYTSALSNKGYNQVLGVDRATSLNDYLFDALLLAEETSEPIKWKNEVEGKPKYFPKEIKWVGDALRWAPPASKGEEGGGGTDVPLTGNETPEEIEQIINDAAAVKSRRAVITLEYNEEIDGFMETLSTGTVEETNKKRRAEFNRKQEQSNDKIKSIAQKKANEMVNECTYFNKISVEDPFLYENIKDKVKHFHPAFHSMTPEGMNGRLNFLKQCTRQGPFQNSRNAPENIAFGKPPICVLRIGDFYHTKIVIDSVNFSFEPLQWDLNPEGVGVQPMIAKVDLNFKFIGGSSLGGPITQLQSAVSFNFFANTSVYNKRKDIVLTKDKKNSDGKTVGSEEELFGYGAFIFPNQVGSSTKDTGLEYIDLTEPSVEVPGDQETEKSESNKMTDTEKKAIEEEFEDSKKTQEEDLKKIQIGSASIDDFGVYIGVTRTDAFDNGALSKEYKANVIITNLTTSNVYNFDGKMTISDVDLATNFAEDTGFFNRTENNAKTLADEITPTSHKIDVKILNDSNQVIKTLTKTVVAEII